jgi:FkbM family methyltransferase
MEDTHLWRLGGRHTGTYIDIGAGHPIADNVSFFFYERGWQGVAVEPQQKLVDLYARMRPRDAAVAALIGTQSGEADFHVFEAFHGLSTTNMKHAEAATALGAGYRTVKVPMITLAELCRKHGLREIDFLKVDVEGAEADVPKSGDWKAFRPKAVVVEAVAPGSNESSWEGWEPFLLAQGYRFMFDTLNRFTSPRKQRTSLLSARACPGIQCVTCTKSDARRRMRAIPSMPSPAFWLEGLGVAALSRPHAACRCSRTRRTPANTAAVDAARRSIPRLSRPPRPHRLRL